MKLNYCSDCRKPSPGSVCCWCLKPFYKRIPPRIFRAFKAFILFIPVFFLKTRFDVPFDIDRRFIVAPFWFSL